MKWDRFCGGVWMKCVRSSETRDGAERKCKQKVTSASQLMQSAVARTNCSVNAVFFLFFQYAKWKNVSFRRLLPIYPFNYHRSLSEWASHAPVARPLFSLRHCSRALTLIAGSLFLYFSVPISLACQRTHTHTHLCRSMVNAIDGHIEILSNTRKKSHCIQAHDTSWLFNLCWFIY